MSRERGLFNNIQTLFIKNDTRESKESVSKNKKNKTIDITVYCLLIHVERELC